MTAEAETAAEEICRPAQQAKAAEQAKAAYEQYESMKTKLLHQVKTFIVRKVWTTGTIQDLLLDSKTQKYCSKVCCLFNEQMLCIIHINFPMMIK